MDEDYSNHPVGIGELRAHREGNTSWTPREALIACLREIDSGVIAPNKLIVMCATETPEITKLDKFYSGVTTLELYGLFELAKLDTFGK